MPHSRRQVPSACNPAIGYSPPSQLPAQPGYPTWHAVPQYPWPGCSVASSHMIAVPTMQMPMPVHPGYWAVQQTVVPVRAALHSLPSVQADGVQYRHHPRPPHHDVLAMRQVAIRCEW
jgi:hypothetical protein